MLRPEPPDRLARRVAVARGDEPADLVIHVGTIFSAAASLVEVTTDE